MDDFLLFDLIETNNGYLEVQKAISVGLSKSNIFQYIKQNNLEKVAPGIYTTEDVWPDDLFVLQSRNPRIIFSHETALYIHGLSDREASQITVTVPRGYNTKHLVQKGITVHSIHSAFYKLGITSAITTAGNTISLYDKERCICDIIRNKKKMDIQFYQTAIKSYFSDSNKNLHMLTQYAKAMHLEEKIRQYTEVLL